MQKLKQRFTFQHGNDSEHTARAAIEGFRLKVFSWPSQSPNMNTIVSLWQDMKSDISVSRCTKAADIQQKQEPEMIKEMLRCAH